jgi:hypothetical protein
MIYWVLVWCALFLFGNWFSEAAKPKDWLKEAFRQSHEVVSEPYSSDLEADDIFQESNAVNIWSDGASLGLNDNVIVRFSRFMMRMAIVIAVAMLIYTGIKVWLALGDDGKLQEALKDAWIVLVGVFLVLASVAIVYLVSSLMRWSLNYDLFN